MATTASERPLSEHFGVFAAGPRESGLQRLWPTPDGSSHRQLRRSERPTVARTSLRKLSEGRRARRLTFYRNGDRFDKGLTYALSLEKVRTFDALLEDLTRVMTDLPMGVRYIFTADGRDKVSQLDSLLEGESYVCASTDHFSKLEYGKQEPPPQWTLSRSTRGIPGMRTSNKLHHFNSGMDSPGGRNFIRPKLVTVMRNGIRPRKAVRILLNHRTARSFEQVLDDVTRVIQLDSGAVRKVFSLGGKQVTCLEDFFGPEDIFIAYGAEKYSHDDFDLDTEECKILNSTVRTPGSCRRERRFYGGRPMSPVSDVSSNLSFRSSHSVSPKLQRKYRPVDNNYFELAESVRNLYIVNHMIGDGNFARVHECIQKSTGVAYALKIIDKNKCKGKEQMIANEVAILRQVKHPNIVQLVEEFDFECELYLVMELVKGGDLFDAIAAATKFCEPEAARMVGHLGSALHYLHSLNIVHRDIKPENLLVGTHSHLKLADFGLAVEMPPDGSALFTVCGTPTYVAPEILAETGYGLNVDIWAMGVIMYILLCGFPPFVSQTNNQDELFDRILTGQFEFMSPYWDEISDSAKELIRGMLHVDIHERFTASRVLSHPWLEVITDKEETVPIARSNESHFDERRRPSARSSGIPVSTKWSS
ncbi:serine/threonine-protein kinase DCLK1-like [Ornithodoros turicata]|uniref:serine/threonine-protein kinase DCLK1-like n=1 Tax=Ornithodoros turicata TaxID=34597 RepID=UPI00313879FF